MGLETVKEYLKKYSLDSQIIILNESSATVDLAAEALNVVSGQIAKSIVF